jgi:hypothetical protein
MSKVVASFLGLIAAWYRSDRIRVSPTTGRLLRIQVGDRLVIRGELYRVAQRDIQETQNSKVLTFELAGSLEPGRLKVRQDRHGVDHRENQHGELTIYESSDWESSERDSSEQESSERESYDRRSIPVFEQDVTILS